MSRQERPNPQQLLDRRGKEGASLAPGATVRHRTISTSESKRPKPAQGSRPRSGQREKRSHFTQSRHSSRSPLQPQAHAAGTGSDVPSGDHPLQAPSQAAGRSAAPGREGEAEPGNGVAGGKLQHSLGLEGEGNCNCAREQIQFLLRLRCGKAWIQVGRDGRESAVGWGAGGSMPSPCRPSRGSGGGL